MKLEVASRCSIKDQTPKSIPRSSLFSLIWFLIAFFCVLFWFFYFLSFLFFCLLFAFKRNPKRFLCPFVLLKFFEKTKKIFSRSFGFFCESLFDCLFVENLKIFYLCFSLGSCLPSLWKNKSSKNISVVFLWVHLCLLCFWNPKIFLFRCSFVFLCFFFGFLSLDLATTEVLFQLSSAST